VEGGRCSRWKMPWCQHTAFRVGQITVGSRNPRLCGRRRPLVSNELAGSTGGVPTASKNLEATRFPAGPPVHRHISARSPHGPTPSGPPQGVLGCVADKLFKERLLFPMTGTTCILAQAAGGGFSAHCDQAISSGLAPSSGMFAPRRVGQCSR